MYGVVRCPGIDEAADKIYRAFVKSFVYFEKKIDESKYTCIVRICLKISNPQLMLMVRFFFFLDYSVLYHNERKGAGAARRGRWNYGESMWQTVSLSLKKKIIAGRNGLPTRRPWIWRNAKSFCSRIASFGSWRNVSRSVNWGETVWRNFTAVGDLEPKIDISYIMSTEASKSICEIHEIRKTCYRPRSLEC